MLDEKMVQCLDYFQGKSSYKKLFLRFRDKYASLGYMGGNVTLTGLTMEEKDQLGGFLQKNYRGNKTVTISAAGFQKGIDSSRFSGLLLEEILNTYFDSPLLGKQQQLREEEEIREKFFMNFIDQWKGKGATDTEASDIGKGSCSLWLLELLENKGEGYRMIMQLYRENKDHLALVLENLFQASVNIPADYEKTLQLPVFAADITGDPHWFDETTFSGKLLLLFLTWKYQLVKDPAISGAEWRNRILFCGGILKDSLSNMVLAYGIMGQDKKGIHPGIKGFYERKEPLYLTLKTLSTITDLWPEKKGANIYVVENPAVFDAIIQARPSACAVCSSGQPRLAALLLLDFLSSHGQLWYAGDFDPEGLEIAQRLKQRYKDRLNFWCYKKEYYDQYRVSQSLPVTRLNKLKKINTSELEAVKDRMLEMESAAYQETMMEIYLKDIREHEQ